MAAKRRKKGQGWGVRASVRHDYMTPPVFINILLKHIGRERFDLDVCCTVPNIPARLRVTENGLMGSCLLQQVSPIDGLSGSWNCRHDGEPALCWMNPPLGPELEKFCSKMLREVEKGAEVWALLPARFPGFYVREFSRNGSAGLQGVLRQASLVYILPEWSIGFGLPENYGKPDCFPTEKKNMAKTSWMLCHFGKNGKEAAYKFRHEDPFKGTKYEGVLFCPA
jgi:hypothetical protein